MPHPSAPYDESSSFQLNWEVFEPFKQRPHWPQSATSVQSVDSFSHNTFPTKAQTQPRAKNTKRLHDESDDTESSNHDRLSTSAKRRSQNRKAQQAFRDRQRKRIDALEQKIESLVVNYTSLQTEYWNLNVAYEGLLMQQGQHPPQPPTERSQPIKTEPLSTEELQQQQPFAREECAQDYFSIPVHDEMELLPTFDLVLNPAEMELDFGLQLEDGLP